MTSLGKTAMQGPSHKNGNVDAFMFFSQLCFQLILSRIRDTLCSFQFRMEQLPLLRTRSQLVSRVFKLSLQDSMPYIKYMFIVSMRDRVVCLARCPTQPYLRLWKAIDRCYAWRSFA